MSDNKRQYNRTYELIIGQVGSNKGLQIIGNEKTNEGLQIDFTIKKHIDNKEKSNSASITLYNLSDDSIKYIERPKMAVQLKVGWDGDNKLLFSGIVDEIETINRVGGTDRKTTLRCKPADNLIYSPRISKTFPANTSPRTIVNYLVSESPSLARASFNSDRIDEKFPFGYTVEGNVKSIMDDLARDYDINYQIDNQRIVVSDLEKYRSPNSVSRAVQFTPNTGLIETPTFASADGKKTKEDKTRKDGVRFQCLINPTLNPGSAVSLKDTTINGIFRINSVTFRGTWRDSNTWYATCLCSKLNAQEV